MKPLTRIALTVALPFVCAAAILGALLVEGGVEGHLVREGHRQRAKEFLISGLALAEHDELTALVRRKVEELLTWTS